MMEFMHKQEDETLKKVVALWDKYLVSGQWTVVSNQCWNRFEPFWELPEDVLEDFRKSDLVLFKGDANSRRVHGDLRWPATTPTKSFTNYLTDHVSIMMVRTLKSETASGISEAKVEELKAKHKETGDEWDWLSTGQYGIVQFIGK
eukprot:TRINITY_DN5533_c0_g1_i1.p1 TRINITY_DN5533_c0_g1~~TRINITY_DN5533_c0_g1_i1.p1  ORF type:complete len:146 (+),score=30.98 TRINITY_DN5533_c0_g1_i1:1423-1860(+)